MALTDTDFHLSQPPELFARADQEQIFMLRQRHRFPPANRLGVSHGRPGTPTLRNRKIGDDSPSNQESYARCQTSSYPFRPLAETT